MGHLCVWESLKRRKNQAGTFHKTGVRTIVRHTELDEKFCAACVCIRTCRAIPPIQGSHSDVPGHVFQHRECVGEPLSKSKYLHWDESGPEMRSDGLLIISGLRGFQGAQKYQKVENSSPYIWVLKWIHECNLEEFHPRGTARSPDI